MVEDRKAVRNGIELPYSLMVKKFVIPDNSKEEEYYKQSNLYSEKFLAKVLDEEERRFWNDHFERLETIKRKYDPYREFEPQGLDGGFREEERERHAENNLLNLYPEPVLDRLPTLLAVLVCSLVFTLKHPSNCCIC